jgi:hypothetical protein
VIPEPGAEIPLNIDELKLLAERERGAARKREQRSKAAQERAQQALAPNPGGFVVPEMPAGLRAQRRWLRDGHDLYSRRQITILELTEMRRSVSAQADTYKAGAIVRQSLAALRSAVATERMADTLAAVEHGGQALVMLSRLQEGLASGQRRPLAPRIVTAMPPPKDSV